ncbi:MAG: alanine racemase [Acidobacteriota bacterium]|nr:alanine racemase [Acidobacteriota bacterium]
MRVCDLPTPALVLDRKRLERNIARMADRAANLGVTLRPHAKTHKCLEVARRQVAAGACGLTVSTLAEADAFSTAGFDDLTWAVPLAPSRLADVERVAARARLGILVDALAAVAALDRRGGSFDVWIKVDCGYHRAGVDSQSDEAARLARSIAEGGHVFRGLLTHSGQAYDCASRAELAVVAEHERRVMVELAERMRGDGIEVPVVSVGSTPAMSAAHDLAGVDEVRPGNYVFFDASQVALGACALTDCAVTVIAEVISNGGGRHAVINAGALALSKDLGPGDCGYGRIYEDYEAGALHDDTTVVELSQEHGEVTGSFDLGERLRIQPNHSCLTSAAFGAYSVVEGDEVVDRWPVVRGW